MIFNRQGKAWVLSLAVVAFIAVGCADALKGLGKRTKECDPDVEEDCAQFDGPGGGALSCEQYAFEQTFYKVATTSMVSGQSCVTCHVPGGRRSDSPFAQEDRQAAWEVTQAYDFFDSTYSTNSYVVNMAGRPDHGPPVTGDVAKQKITAALRDLKAVKEECETERAANPPPGPPGSPPPPGTPPPPGATAKQCDTANLITFRTMAKTPLTRNAQCNGCHSGPGGQGAWNMFVNDDARFCRSVLDFEVAKPNRQAGYAQSCKGATGMNLTEAANFQKWLVDTLKLDK